MVQADCGNHRNISKVINVKVAVKITITTSIVASVALVITLVSRTLLQPQSPQFVLLSLTVNQFELSGQPDNYQTSVVARPTISSLNRNHAIGIHYERFAFSVAYKDQQITAAGEAPPLYQGHKDVQVIQSASFLAGYQIPVAPHLCGALAEDDKAGYIVLTVNVDAQIRWKFGLWTSGRQHLAVSCPAAISFQNVGGGRTSVVEFQRTSVCSVSS